MPTAMSASLRRPPPRITVECSVSRLQRAAWRLTALLVATRWRVAARSAQLVSTRHCSRRRSSCTRLYYLQPDHTSEWAAVRVHGGTV